MENKLTDEEIVRVFGMYIGTKYRYKNEFGTYINNSFLGIHVRGHIQEGAVLLLKPLSGITDEDAIEVAHLMGYTDINNKKFLIQAGKSEAHNPIARFCTNMFLISKGYAVPLFFSPGHWANGKTAIELGIAIDSTKQ